MHLVGNSLGGIVAMAVAARRPELVRTLTLLAPAMPDRRPDPRRVSDPWALLGMLPWLRPRVARRLSELTPRDRIDQMIRLCFGDPSSVLEHRVDEAVRESLERARQPWAGEALWHTTKGMIGGWFVGPSLWTVASLVSMPTLVVWGDRDRLVSPKLAGRTAAVLQRGRFAHAPPGVGHGFHRSNSACRSGPERCSACGTRRRLGDGDVGMGRLPPVRTLIPARRISM